MFSFSPLSSICISIVNVDVIKKQINTCNVKYMYFSKIVEADSLFSSDKCINYSNVNVSQRSRSSKDLNSCNEKMKDLIQI